MLQGGGHKHVINLKFSNFDKFYFIGKVRV